MSYPLPHQHCVGAGEAAGQVSYQPVSGIPELWLPQNRGFDQQVSLNTCWQQSGIQTVNYDFETSNISCNYQTFCLSCDCSKEASLLAISLAVGPKENRSSLISSWFNRVLKPLIKT